MPHRPAAVTVQSENEYEDLLGLWSDLEAGLGIILGSPNSIQEFEQRVWQYDRWMKTLLQRDTDVGLYLLFQLATNSPVGYSASHALVSAVLCHLIAVELIALLNCPAILQPGQIFVRFRDWELAHERIR